MLTYQRFRRKYQTNMSTASMLERIWWTDVSFIAVSKPKQPMEDDREGPIPVSGERCTIGWRQLTDGSTITEIRNWIRFAITTTRLPLEVDAGKMSLKAEQQRPKYIMDNVEEAFSDLPNRPLGLKTSKLQLLK